MILLRTEREQPQRIFSQSMLLSTIAGVLIVGVLAGSIDWEFLGALDFEPLWEYRVAFIRGLGLTLLIAIECVVVGLALGVVLAALLQAPIGPFRWLIVAYVELFRNTPLIVQLFWIHFALPILTGISTDVLISGGIAITLQAGAYLTDLARTGIQAVPRGQWEAAFALGLPAKTRWLSIILPQALRIIIPPLANIAIGFFKVTAILTAISVPELMSTATRISQISFRPIETLTVVAAIYFMLGTAFSFGTYRLEALMRRSGT